MVVDGTDVTTVETQARPGAEHLSIRWVYCREGKDWRRLHRDRAEGRTMGEVQCGDVKRVIGRKIRGLQ